MQKSCLVSKKKSTRQQPSHTTIGIAYVTYTTVVTGISRISKPYFQPLSRCAPAAKRPLSPQPASTARTFRSLYRPPAESSSRKAMPQVNTSTQPTARPKKISQHRGVDKGPFSQIGMAERLSSHQWEE
ncbi:hypothetical protein BDV96DRAFT_592891 [Lophiotrema nucula]|uniref:Uncharacterized protein n=1 Tax=Lophiotrema nucula TaxID=690887 RepID=A0A6A5YD37_9PLEO|nr:hypothetical protein BDV96DRAFT_592891 [Lophiotrema nucula]